MALGVRRFHLWRRSFFNCRTLPARITAEREGSSGTVTITKSKQWGCLERKEDRSKEHRCAGRWEEKRDHHGGAIVVLVVTKFDSTQQKCESFAVNFVE